MFCKQTSCYYLRLLYFFNLFQTNNVISSLGYSLDLLFTTLLNISVFPSLEPVTSPDSYRPPLDFQIYIALPSKQPHSPNIKKNFFKANYSVIKEYLLTIYWDKRLRELTVEESVKFLYHHLNLTIDNFVPTTSRYLSTFPSWFSR